MPLPIVLSPGDVSKWCYFETSENGVCWSWFWSDYTFLSFRIDLNMAPSLSSIDWTIEEEASESYSVFLRLIPDSKLGCLIADYITLSVFISSRLIDDCWTKECSGDL